VVLDVGRNLDTLAIHALDRAWRVYPVMQASVPDVRHARRLLEAFRSLGYAPEKTEVIVNRYDKAAEIGLEQVQRSLGTARMRTVPNSFKEVSKSINQGDALGKSARNNPVARQLAELALALSPRAEEQRSLLGRIFRRA
jgi:pilus assembly protein CpaE